MHLIYYKVLVQRMYHRSVMSKYVNTRSDYLKSSVRAQNERLWFQVCADVTQSVVSGFWGSSLDDSTWEEKVVLIDGLHCTQTSQVTVEIFAGRRNSINREHCVKCLMHCLAQITGLDWVINTILILNVFIFRGCLSVYSHVCEVVW